MNRRTIFLGLLVMLSFLCLVICPFIGIELISFDVLWGAGEVVDRKIFWSLRIPRVLLAFLAGSGLAVSGMVFQAVFRNPLATPFTLGVASGSALGAAVAVNAGIQFTIFGLNMTSLFAFAGALGAIGIVYGLSRIRREFSSSTLLLAGVAVSFLFSSIILFIQYISDFTNAYRIIRWIMGGIRATGFSDVMQVIPFIIPGMIATAVYLLDLNLLSTGEDIAASRGVNVVRTRKVLFFLISLQVGGIVAVCGPIGFIGMMSPHICRLLIGSDHRYLFPASALFGGFFLILCDTVARIVIPPAEMPVGIITALIGGPFFIWLLLTGTERRSIMR